MQVQYDGDWLQLSHILLLKYKGAQGFIFGGEEGEGKTVLWLRAILLIV